MTPYYCASPDCRMVVANVDGDELVIIGPKAVHHGHLHETRIPVRELLDSGVLPNRGMKPQHTGVRKP